MDKTPILDIKPYTRYDSLENFTEPEWISNDNNYEVSFQEQALELTYCDYDTGMDFSGGKLIICKSEIASILLPIYDNAGNNLTPKTLLDFIPREY